MMRYALTPFQGFGDPDVPERFCTFDVRAVNGTYPDWQQDMLSSTRQIAGSSSYVTQINGFGPATITLDLRFATRADFMRFRTYLGAIGTLSLLAKYTSHEGLVRTWADKDYEQYGQTLLLSIAESHHHLNGMVRCKATFQRAYDPGVLA